MVQRLCVLFLFLSVVPGCSAGSTDGSEQPCDGNPECATGCCGEEGVCIAADTPDAVCVCADPRYTGTTCDECSDPKFTGATCDECFDPKFAGDDCVECADPIYTGADCDKCADPTYTGANCDECADPRYTGADCEECADSMYAGANCDECADPTYTGVDCDECSDPTYTGVNCDECSDPTYAGASCDECADPHFALPDCTTCVPKYTGANCDECLPDYNGPGCEWFCDNGNVGPACDEVEIPPGTYTAGSPADEACRDPDETAHTVILTGSYSLKRTEVTQAEWEALMGNEPSNNPGCDECPVEGVSWWESLAYCNALSEAEGLAECYTLEGCGPGKPGTVDWECTGVTVNAPDENVYACDGYRLPTEAEWEIGARAGTTTATYNGDTAEENCWGASPGLEPIAWYIPNSNSQTHPVAVKAPNAWGLHDTLGNVGEMVWDRSGDYVGDVTDPTGPPSGGNRVFRGCSWFNFARSCRAADRVSCEPGGRFVFVGLRPARSLR